MSNPEKASTCSPDVAAQIAAARGGSREAFSLLVDRHAAHLLAFLRLRAASREDAEELHQETFLRAWQRLDRYDPRWRFSTWLFTIGQRLTISRYRRRPAPLAGGDDLPEGVAPDDPLRAASDSELRDDLWALADQVLSAAARQALWLRYVEDLSAREIAAVLDKREATVRGAMKSAKDG